MNCFSPISRKLIHLRHPSFPAGEHHNHPVVVVVPANALATPSSGPRCARFRRVFRSDQVAIPTVHPAMLAGGRVAVIADLRGHSSLHKVADLAFRDGCARVCEQGAHAVQGAAACQRMGQTRGLMTECALQFVGALIQLAIRSTASRSMPMKPCQCKASQTLPVGFSPPLTMISFLVCAFFKPRRMAGTSCG